MAVTFLTLGAVVEEGRAALGRVRAGLAAIVDYSGDAISSESLDGTILSWNAAPERKDIENMQRTNYETRRRRKDGTEIDVAITLSPIRDEQGDVVGVSAITHDITERLRAEREDLLKDLQSAVKARDEFLSIASHELNTPLTPLKLQVAMLRREPFTGPKAASALEMISGSSPMLQRSDISTGCASSKCS